MDVSLHRREHNARRPREGHRAKFDVLRPFNQKFSDQISLTIRNLTKLTHLVIFSNNLSGMISPEVGDLISLTFLDLSKNQLSGQLPKTI